MLARIFAAVFAAGLLALSTPVIASATPPPPGVCPPAGSLWSSSAKFTGEADNYGGSNYDLNNNQWGQQPTSTQTIYLSSVGGTWGLCGVFQPVTSPNTVKSYPNITQYESANNVDTFTTISSTWTELGFPSGVVGDWQFMYDIWANCNSVSDCSNSSAIEMEYVTDRHEAGSPGGTFLGTATLSGVAFDVYTFTGPTGQTAYEFHAQTNVTTGTAHIKGAWDWLQNHASVSLSIPFDQIDAGFEIPDIESSTGGKVGGAKVTAYSVTAS